MFDVTVIGAGPAGSVAAMLLARHGWPVTLIEQHRFPREKVCGECLSALGIEVLGRLQLMDSLRAMRPITLTHALLHSNDGQTARIDLPRPMFGISRPALDTLLLDAARRAGVTIRQPARCEGTSDLRIRDLESNRVEALRTNLVVVADGKSALFGDPPPINTGTFGIKSHWTDVQGPRDAIELFGFDDCYGGMAAIEGDRWNLALSAPAARLLRCKGNLDQLLADLLRENPTFRHRVARARPSGDWLASPLPRFGVRASWPACAIPVGNAAAAIEPIGGEGMGLALRSAELAASALVECDGRWDERKSQTLRHAYLRLWRARRATCRAGGVVAANPALAAGVLLMLGANGRLASGVMKLLGK
jgi:flavin-dependent dehydrogenase